MATPKRSTFELVGADGRPLRGDVRTASSGAAQPAVIVAHGFKGFKDWGFFPHVADRLARAGITAVTFNFSGSGIGTDGESFSEPERFGHATFSNDLRDIETVRAALFAGALAPNVPAPTTVGLWGHSRGGGAAVLYAARERSVSALVTWAAIASPFRWDEDTLAQWRRDGKLDIVNARTGEVLPLYTDLLDDFERNAEALDIVRAASNLTVPWLIVHGEVDESVPVAEARRLHAAAAPATTRLLIVQGGGHTFGARHPWAGSTAELDQAVESTVSWLCDNL